MAAWLARVLKWISVKTGLWKSTSVDDKNSSSNSGETEKADDHEAARLYQLAADQGDADAQYMLAHFYSEGRGGLPEDDHDGLVEPEARGDPMSPLRCR